VIPPELKKKGEEGDKYAIQEIEDIDRLRASIEDSLIESPGTPPKAKKITGYMWPDGHQEDAYMFGRVDSHHVHYLQDQKVSFLCQALEYEKRNRQATCCKMSTQDPMLMHASVILVYETDKKGTVIPVPADRQRKLDEEHKLDFKFAMKVFTMSDSRIRALKEHTLSNPTISNDFFVWTEKQGNQDRVKFSPCGQALWQQRGKTFFKKILTDGGEMWKEAYKQIAKEMTIDDIDKIFGVQSALSDPNRGSASVDYSSLIQ